MSTAHHPDGPSTLNTKPWVTLRCKKCGLEHERAPKHPSDPDGTAVVLMQCPRCNRGDFCEPSYLDALGNEIIWRG